KRKRRLVFHDLKMQQAGTDRRLVPCAVGKKEQAHSVCRRANRRCFVVSPACHRFPKISDFLRCRYFPDFVFLKSAPAASPRPDSDPFPVCSRVLAKSRHTPRDGLPIGKCRPRIAAASPTSAAPLSTPRIYRSPFLPESLCSQAPLGSVLRRGCASIYWRIV